MNSLAKASASSFGLFPDGFELVGGGALLGVPLRGVLLPLVRGVLGVSLPFEGCDDEVRDPFFRLLLSSNVGRDPAINIPAYVIGFIFSLFHASG